MADFEEFAVGLPDSDIVEPMMQIPSVLPALPLRDIVIYPFMIVPLFVSRDKSIKAVEEALKDNRMIVLVSQKDLNKEDPGREDLFEGVDLSRTAGWFTAIYPVRVELSPDGAPGDDLVAVKEQLRAVPARGIGYGLLRWLGDDAEIAGALAALPPAEVSFNYLGRMDVGAGGEGTLFTAADADAGPARSPAGRRTHLVAVDAAVRGGRLSAVWTYGRRVHHEATVERLATAFMDELRALVAHCRDPQAGAFTPSDFDLAGLDQGGLDTLLAQIGR